MSTRRDPERDLEQLFDGDGGEIGRLYRRLPHYDPPRRLDRDVLGEAARAVHSGRRPRRQRWLFGVGSAAGIVLAAGIAWRIGHDALNAPVPGAVPTTAPAPATRRVVPVEPIDEAARAPANAATQAEEPRASAPAASEAEPAIAKAKPRVPPPRIQNRARELPKAPPPGPPAAPPAPPPPAPAQAVAPEAFPQAERDSAADQERNELSSGQRGFQSGTATGAAAPAARLSEDKVKSEAPTVPTGSSVELKRDMQLAPDDWLAHIRELENQGRHQQAIESLRLFRRMHPNRRIPQDLRALEP